MALGYAWFDSYDSVGYVLTYTYSPHTVYYRSLGISFGFADVIASGSPDGIRGATPA